RAREIAGEIRSLGALDFLGPGAVQHAENRPGVHPELLPAGLRRNQVMLGHPPIEELTASRLLIAGFFHKISDVASVPLRFPFPIFPDDGVITSRLEGVVSVQRETEIRIDGSPRRRCAEELREK